MGPSASSWAAHRVRLDPVNVIDTTVCAEEAPGARAASLKFTTADVPLRFVDDSFPAVLNHLRQAPPVSIPFPFPAFFARFLSVCGSSLSSPSRLPWTLFSSSSRGLGAGSPVFCKQRTRPPAPTRARTHTTGTCHPASAAPRRTHAAAEAVRAQRRCPRRLF